MAVAVPLQQVGAAVSAVAISEPGPFEVFAMDPSSRWVPVPVLTGR
jgi:hypothetical protein